MTRWLVTGAAGLLGSELVAALAGQEVLAVGHAELDITADAAAPALRRWAAGGHPLVVLNAAAYTDVDGAETDRDAAYAVNATGPGRLAALCAELDAVLVHVSTDYVFDGRASRPYEVDDPVAPGNVYGASKAAGEDAVRAAMDRHYVVRTSWVYGGGRPNFVSAIAAAARRQDVLEVADDQRSSPTWSHDLAHGLVELAGSGAPFGTYHCTGGGVTSRYGLARAVLEELGEDPARVRPCASTRFPRPAARPAYSALSPDSWPGARVRPLPHWRSQLATAFRAQGDALGR